MKAHILARLALAALLMPLPALAAAEHRSFTTSHKAETTGGGFAYQAAVEEFVIEDKAHKPALSLFSTSYIRSGVRKPAERPVIFLFNGGPSAAAIGLHMEFGPIHEAPATSPSGTAPRFEANRDTLLDVADLVMFDPAETGFSRLLPGGDRAYFYSVEGDAESLAQLVVQWLKAHGRESSPVYLLGESYGSIRQVVAGGLLAKRGVAISGQIIFGNSIFLQETSRRTHNIVSSAVSLPLLAMTAAYHGKADMGGKSEAAFLDEVYAYSTGDYLLALSRGYDISNDEAARVADRLAAYTGIPASYYRDHGLTIAKQDFNKMLVPGKPLNSNDTRRFIDPTGKPDFSAAAYGPYMQQELKVALPGVDYRGFAPGAFEGWNWGNGCNDYLLASGLCIAGGPLPSIFMDYDWPEQLKRQFADPKFRTMIVSSYYDGLSSIGTHRYLRTQLGYPKDRFELHEYAAGHATGADPKARPQVAADIRAFIRPR